MEDDRSVLGALVKHLIERRSERNLVSRSLSKVPSGKLSRQIFRLVLNNEKHRDWKEFKRNENWGLIETEFGNFFEDAMRFLSTLEFSTRFSPKMVFRLMRDASKTVVRFDHRRQMVVWIVDVMIESDFVTLGKGMDFTAGVKAILEIVDGTSRHGRQNSQLWRSVARLYDPQFPIEVSRDRSNLLLIYKSLANRSDSYPKEIWL